jgi:RNA recognition motif-containing protein
LILPATFFSSSLPLFIVQQMSSSFCTSNASTSSTDSHSWINNNDGNTQDLPSLYNTRSKNNRSNQIQSHDHELYVGDLSFFCQELDLIKLFAEFGLVEECRIIRNRTGVRSLMFGFVCLSTKESALAAIGALHNKLFMGRPIK